MADFILIATLILVAFIVYVVYEYHHFVSFGDRS